MKRGDFPMFRRKEVLSDKEILSNYMFSLSEEERLRLELKETKLALDAAYSTLQNVTEPELIDSAIYQMKAIQSRYTFLTSKYREISA